ncbi:hypothetical protein [Streptomyces stelliscabiei]|uniref:hypothetical protein n=1 Tax=Streptomyces stelliscabiei TaxID=146820 RepID=UPI002FF15ECE
MTENFWAGLLEAGWAARLRSKDGQTRFQLRYYGELFEGLIVGDDLPALVYAVTESGQQILLFDGAVHGYDAMFCDSWDEDRLRTRRADQVYVDADGEDTFELVVWVGYNIDWEDERQSFVDADDPDFVTLIDGRRLPFEVVRHTAFDAVSITATNARGRPPTPCQRSWPERCPQRAGLVGRGEPNQSASCAQVRPVQRGLLLAM